MDVGVRFAHPNLLDTGGIPAGLSAEATPPAVGGAVRAVPGNTMVMEAEP